MKKLFYVLLVASLVGYVSCSKDDDENDLKGSLDRTSLTMYVDDTEELKYSGKSCSWRSDNSLIASVDNGVVTANHVGTTKIYANDAVCKVGVRPMYNNFYEPCTIWGTTQSTVKSYMAGYSLRGSDNKSLAFNGKNNTIGYIYMFDNGRLSAGGVIVNLINANYLTDFLLERYVVINVEEDGNDYNIYMLSLDQRTYLMCILNTNGMTALYMDAEKIINSGQTKIDSMNRMARKINTLK